MKVFGFLLRRYRKAMENPGMRQKINKLMAAGLLSFGGPGAGGGQK